MFTTEIIFKLIPLQLQNRAKSFLSQSIHISIKRVFRLTNTIAIGCFEGEPRELSHFTVQWASAEGQAVCVIYYLFFIHFYFSSSAPPLFAFFLCDIKTRIPIKALEVSTDSHLQEEQKRNWKNSLSSTCYECLLRST